MDLGLYHRKREMAITVRLILPATALGCLSNPTPPVLLESLQSPYLTLLNGSVTINGHLVYWYAR
jgi:hypothetical protein